MKKRYNRIFILGGIGSGKSTLAKQISERTNIRNYGLDWIVYKDTHSWKEKYSKKIRDKKLKELIKKKKWVIDGAYVESWIFPIIKKADLIIILKLPRTILMKRVFNRYIRNKLHKKGDSFKDMLTLLKCACLYKNNNFFTHKNMVEKNKKEYIVLRDNKDINELIKKIKK